MNITEILTSVSSKRAEGVGSVPESALMFNHHLLYSVSLIVCNVSLADGCRGTLGQK